MSLKIKNLAKRFENKMIFDDFSYDFEDKGIYALSGGSGSGKTTLLRIIAGLDKKYDGEIVGGGNKNVSFCFQEYRLFPTLTSIENITEVSFSKASEQDIQKAESLLLNLGFSKNDMKLFPDELSGGMKQRVNFARSVLKNSPILILDEPTKELDEVLVEKILDIMSEESKKRLVIFTTHKPEEISMLNAKEIKIN